MAAKKRIPSGLESDIETLTPAINLDGSRPAPRSPGQAAVDADNQQLYDDALAGRIKLPGVNSASGTNPANPYAGEGRDPNWKPPPAKDFDATVGDAIVDAVPALRTWGSSEQDEKPKEETKGDLTFVDRPDGGAAWPAPRVVPAHEVDLVSPERDKAEQDAYSHIKSGYGDQRSALEGQKSAEDEVAQARVALNNARAEGDQKVADVADQARWNTEARALNDKTSQDTFRAKMDAFSSELANDKIEYKSSAPQQVTWMIARALGSVQQGLLGLSSNQVADQIDAHIKQSLDAKKANHDIKKGRLGDMQKFYDMAASQSKDQGERSRLAYGYALEAAKAEAAKLANAAGNPLALAEAKKIQAALDEKSAQIETVGEYGTELTAAQASIRNHKWVQAGVEGGGGKSVDSKNVYFDSIDGRYYAARSEKDKEKLAESVELVGRIKASAERYQRSLGKINTGEKLVGKTGLDTDDMSEARSAHIALLTDIRDANKEGGVIREGLMKAGIYEDSIVSPDRLTGNADKQIGVIVDRTKSLHSNVTKALAPVPVDAAPQPYGSAPKSIPTGKNREEPRKVKPSAVGFEPAGARAKGGGVDEQPYLVGEKGPELVVPNKPGFVMTALQTAALRGAPPTKQQADTLPKGAPKSAIQRYAEKMGVAREDGGDVTPEPPKESHLGSMGKNLALATLMPAALIPAAGHGLASIVQDIRAAAARKKAEEERASVERAESRRTPELTSSRTDRLEITRGPDREGVPERNDPDRSSDETFARPSYVPRNAGALYRTSQLAPAHSPLSEGDVRGAQKREDGGAVLPLYEPEGHELHQSLDGHAYYAANEQPESTRPSLSGPSPRFSEHVPVRSERAAHAAPPRRRESPEDLMRMANELERSMRSEHEARMAEGPAVHARACGGAMRPKGLAASISRDLETAKRGR